MPQMDAKQAASLIEQWIAFYDMDNPQAWDRDDYTFVQQSCRTMRAAIQVLRGKSAPDQRKLADGLEEFIEDSFMDDPHEWEPENRAFVKQAMEALQYTAAQLRKSSTGAGARPATGAPQQRGNQAAQGKSAAKGKGTPGKTAAPKSPTGQSSSFKTTGKQSSNNQPAVSKNSTNKSNKKNSTNKTHATQNHTSPSTLSKTNNRGGGRGKNGGR
ncbi:hypothetical protein L2089_09750 [Paenibacillus hunanensis]|uniref:hypothetical protein n=1 Tax=Paenibacillus hunanensis TaxID=539262 RepID=UPI002025E738|nr:hypothetical protein [Paenibacillus hunanensis]MCL9660967.1 hypothetical protein [Paenibacillus hunanensis]